MNIPYVENDVSETVEMIVDTEEILSTLRDNGQIENPTYDYASDCYDMCNIMTFIIGNKLNKLCEPETLLVKEGVFGMIGNHTWLEIEGVIIDGTLKQFIPKANKMSIIDSSFDQYFAVKSYTFENWVNESSNFL